MLLFSYKFLDFGFWFLIQSKPLPPLSCKTLLFIYKSSLLNQEKFQNSKYHQNLNCWMAVLTGETEYITRLKQNGQPVYCTYICMKTFLISIDYAYIDSFINVR